MSTEDIYWTSDQDYDVQGAQSVASAWLGICCILSAYVGLTGEPPERHAPASHMSLGDRGCRRARRLQQRHAKCDAPLEVASILAAGQSSSTSF